MPAKEIRHIGNAPQRSLGNEIDGWIPKRISQQHGYHIAKGSEEGSKPISSYGKHVATGEVLDSVLWADGNWHIPPSVGVQVSVVSTSEEDSPTGTGIRSVHLHYLDADLNEMSEEVFLNGITPVLTTATDIRFVQCAHIDTFGSLKKSAGIITFKDSGDLTRTYNQIDAGEVRCSSSTLMIPKDKIAVISGVVGSSISGTSAAKASVSICTSIFQGHDYTQDEILIPHMTIGIQDIAIPYTLPVPIIAVAGEVVGMKFSVDKGATITGGWFGWLENIKAYNG